MLISAGPVIRSYREQGRSTCPRLVYRLLLLTVSPPRHVSLGGELFVNTFLLTCLTGPSTLDVPPFVVLESEEDVGPTVDTWGPHPHSRNVPR